MKRSLPSIVAGSAIIIVLALYMVTYQVRFNEVAVLRTFGRITPPDSERGQSPDVKREPGLYWKWPWPIQRVQILDNRLQLTETLGEETPSRDAKNIIVTTAASWKIDDPYIFSIRNADLQTADRNLQNRIRNDQKTVIARYDFTNFVSTNQAELKYDDIEKELLAVVGPAAKELYGIDVRYIGMESFALPKSITESVFTAMKEERNAEAARYTSAGESEAARIKAEAESIAGTIVAFADRKANQIIAEGKQRAAAYNQTFAQDPDLAIFLMEMDYLGKILKDRTTVILDAEPPFDLLKQVVRSSAGKATTRPAGAAPLPEIVEPK